MLVAGSGPFIGYTLPLPGRNRFINNSLHTRSFVAFLIDGTREEGAFMPTFVSQLEISLYPVPLGESPGDIGPITLEAALSLSVAVVVPCLALSSISLSGAFPSAPVLAAEAVIIPASSVFVPALGIYGVLFAMAACCLVVLVGFYGKYTGRYRPSYK